MANRRAVAFPGTLSPASASVDIMRVREIMTSDPACGSPSDSLEAIARLMVVNDCGSVPVCEGEGGAKRIVGLVTDRDIVVRAVAAGRNPVGMKAEEVMSHPVAFVDPEADLETALTAMEENQVRRIPVVDNQGSLVGMLAQADVALNAAPAKSGELVQSVSKSVDLGGL